MSNTADLFARFADPIFKNVPTVTTEVAPIDPVTRMRSSKIKLIEAHIEALNKGEPVRNGHGLTNLVGSNLIVARLSGGMAGAIQIFDPNHGWSKSATIRAEAELVFFTTTLDMMKNGVYDEEFALVVKRATEKAEADKAAGKVRKPRVSKAEKAAAALQAGVTGETPTTAPVEA